MFDRMGPVQTDAASSVAQLVPGPLGPASRELSYHSCPLFIVLDHSPTFTEERLQN